jgi:N-acetylglutamate synthase
MSLTPANLTLAQRIEQHAFLAWPSMAQMAFDGWCVRLAQGYSDRANSVTPLACGDLTRPDKLRWCERFYNDRQLPVIFRISDLCPEPDFDAWLESQRYRMSWMMETAAAPLQNAPTAPGHVQLLPSADDAWVDAALAADSKIALHLAPFRFIVDHMPQPKVFARIDDKGTPVAVGAATLGGDLMAVFLMRTKAEARRQGHGRAILNALMAWGASRGATTVWLQFDQDGEAQTQLYRSAGFQPVYHYHYRKQTTSRGV